MPVPVAEITSDDPFPVKPDTNEYRILAFLVAHREYGYTPREIADRTALSESTVSNAIGRLSEVGLIERTDNVYYVNPHRASELKERLELLDSVVQLFESAPDDSYAEEGWEQEVPNLDPAERTDTSEENSKTAEAQAEAIITDIEDSHSTE